MKTIKFYLPATNSKKFIKLCTNTQERVDGFSFEVGEPYEKVFTHKIRDCEGSRTIKMWHEIREVMVTIPDTNNWELIVSYKEGMMFIVDPTTELSFSNPNHGAEYSKCDICGHRVFNSHVVRNKKTGEELQVGGECLKKFGLDSIKYISKFCKELYASFDLMFDIMEGESDWTVFSKAVVCQAIKTSDLIKAARSYYIQNNGQWIKGFYNDNGHYERSLSSQAIARSVLSGECEGDDEYINSVCEYIKSLPAKNEFSEEMLNMVSSFYSKPVFAAHAFFAIKAYEEMIARRESNLEPLTQGVQVKVVGEIVDVRTNESFYGIERTYKIKTSKGYIVYRKGKVPEGENRSTEFYAIVKFISERGNVYLDRATKNPKKGIEVKEI